MRHDPSAAGHPADASKLKWHVLVGSFGAYMFEGMDIVMLAVALPLIIDELHISAADGGLLFTATLLGVGLAGVTMGWFTDRFGRRLSLLLTLVSFSFFTVGIAFATTWWQIMAMRFLAGLGLGGIYGVVSSYVAETWPSHHRARAVAFVLSSFSIGAALASAAGGWLMPLFGWRALFLTGTAGLVWAIYVYFKCPESPVWLAERAKRRAGGAQAKHSEASMAAIFAPGIARKTILATVASVFTLGGYWGATTWLPAFLIKERGLSVASMGLSLTLLAIAMFVGYNVFGWLADLYGKKKIIIVSFIGAALTLPIYVVAEDKTIVFWMGPVYGFFLAFFGLFGSYFAEFYPTSVRATGVGFCFNVSRGLSAFAPFLLGSIATSYSFGFGIALCALAYVIAAVCILFIPSAATSAIEAAEERAALPVGPAAPT